MVTLTRARKLFLWLGLALMLSLAVVGARAAVTLLYFRAFGMLDHVFLDWETASELDNAGFYITRSLELEGVYERVSEFFPSQGGSIGGWSYTAQDFDVIPGVTYYYKLEMVDTVGNSAFSDPAVATFWDGTPSPTPTATEARTATPLTPSSTATETPTEPAAGPTSSATATATQGTPTGSATVTPAATQATPGSATPTATQATPGSATVTRTVTGTVIRTATRTPTRTRTGTLFPGVTFTSRPTTTDLPTETGTITPNPSETLEATTTLLPLPSITLRFPVYSPTATVTITLTPSMTMTPTITPTPAVPRTTLRQNFLFAVIGLLWLLLGGFLVAVFRRSLVGNGVSR